jgi:hypothetical protein
VGCRSDLRPRARAEVPAESAPQVDGEQPNFASADHVDVEVDEHGRSRRQALGTLPAEDTTPIIDQRRGVVSEAEATSYLDRQ